MNDKFLLMIQAALDSKGIKSDYNKLKQMLEKDPAKINAIMDMSATKTEINKFIKEYAPQLQKMFKDIGVNVNLKDLETSMKNVFNESEKAAKQFQKDIEQAYKMNESYNKKAIADQKKLYSDIEQAYKTNSSINNKKTSVDKKYYTDIDQAYKANTKLNDSIAITKIRADAAQKSLNTYSKSLKSSYVKEYKDRINDLSNAFEKVKQTGDRAEFSKATASLQQFKSQMKDVGAETSSFTQIIKENISSFTNWYLIGGAVSSLIGNFKEAIGTIKEVDTLLTEISKTSDLSGNRLKQLGIDAYDAASKYGNTVQSYLSGFLEMSRGTDEDTAKGLAELSILAQSAGDMTADLANSYIVATNAAYKLGNNVTQLNAILDGQNQITNRNQVSMSDLAEATKVAGSQAAQSGVAVNEMTAAMGTMIASTKQGGDIAGRAFKGILMNLQQVSGEIDGEVFNEDSFKKVEETLNDVGVATEEIVNGTAKLRDPIEILKELAKVYNSLPSDSVDKANIISDLGGKLYHVMQKCITRIYLIAGNPLEPYTTI